MQKSLHTTRVKTAEDSSFVGCYSFFWGGGGGGDCLTLKKMALLSFVVSVTIYEATRSFGPSAPPLSKA
jgi:hypothetical protein